MRSFAEPVDIAKAAVEESIGSMDNSFISSAGSNDSDNGGVSLKGHEEGHEAEPSDKLADTTNMDSAVAALKKKLSMDIAYHEAAHGNVGGAAKDIVINSRASDGSAAVARGTMNDIAKHHSKGLDPTS